MSQEGKSEHFVDVEEEKWLSNLLYPRQPRDKRPHYVPRGDTTTGSDFYEITKRLSSKSTQISEMKTRIERYLWNLGGCSTYALGYGVNEPHDSEMALPALEDVKKMAIQNQELKVEVDRLNSFYKEGVRIDEDRLKELSELKAEVEKVRLIEKDWLEHDCGKMLEENKQLKECLGKCVEAGKTLSNLLWKIHISSHVSPLNSPKSCTICIDANNAQEVYATAQRLMGEGER